MGIFCRYIIKNRICVEVKGCRDWHVGYMLHWALFFHDMIFKGE